MESIVPGMFARAKAGHDKGSLYLIVKTEPEYVYLADGRRRPLSKPKKKKWKHIQIIKKIRMEKPQDGYRDLEIKRTIKKYQEEANV